VLNQQQIMIFSYAFENNIKLVLPELFLCSSIIGLLFFGSFVSLSRNYRYPLVATNVNYLLVLALALTLLLVANNPLVSGSVFNGIFIVDWLSTVAKISVLLSSIGCLSLSSAYVKTNQINNFEYFVIVALAVFGQLVLISSADFLTAYLALEIQSFAFYLMAAFKRDSAYSTEAGLKYFLLGSFSSTLLLFGVSLLYGFFGTTNFSILSLLLFESTDFQSLADVSFFLILIGLLFKLAAAPFHVWSPDVYEGSPLNSTIFFAIVPKISILVLFFRVYSVLGNNSDIWGVAILVSSICSVIIGSFVTLKQKRLKKLLAYSGINHVGYLLLGASMFTLESVSSVFFYLFSYMITGLCIWGIVSVVKRADSTGSHTATLADLGAMVKVNPILAFILSICLFSLAGIPPLIGFYAKLGIFQSAINSGFFVIASFIIMTSVISTFYYIRLIKSAYFESSHKEWIFYAPVSATQGTVITLSFFGIVFLFYNPLLLNLLSYKMAMSLFL
jgi:NADH-quinone oxidoreductase subunit N